MPEALYPPSRPLSVGEILDSAFRVFGVTLLRCLPYAALGRIAAQLPNIYYLLTGRARAVRLGTVLMDPRWWGMDLIGIALSAWLWSAMLLHQHAIATRRGTAIGPELALATRKLPGVLLMLLILSALIMVFAIPLGASLGLGSAGVMRGSSEMAAGAGIALLTALVVLIPVSWLALRWSSAVIVYVLGPAGWVESMGRSWRLTSGSFWRLSLVYTVALVLVLVLYALSLALTGLVAMLMAGGDVAVITAVTSTAVVLLSAVALPFYTALALVVLGDLSVRKEGADLAQRIAASAAT